MPVRIRPAEPQDALELYQMITELASYERAEECVKVTAYDLEKQLRDVNRHSNVRLRKSTEKWPGLHCGSMPTQPGRVHEPFTWKTCSFVRNFVGRVWEKL